MEGDTEIHRQTAGLFKNENCYYINILKYNAHDFWMCIFSLMSGHAWLGGSLYFYLLQILN